MGSGKVNDGKYTKRLRAMQRLCGEFEGRSDEEGEQGTLSPSDSTTKWAREQVSADELSAWFN